MSNETRHVVTESMPSEPALEETLAEKYELLHELGRGGMGVVYHGRHRLLDKPVAIKFVQAKLDESRFLREARLLARLDSPHVVRVHDFDISPRGEPMLVMELVEGDDLKDRIKRQNGPLDEVLTLDWMRQVANGLLAAAEQGIIHRDIKPSNIRIDRKGQARIMDFGLSRSHNDGLNLTQANAGMGTPLYMAPEQAEDARSVDTRADIYSFGATFYEALTGRPPFSGDSSYAIWYKHKTEPLVAPQSLNPGLSRTTCEVLERCLAKSPEHRFSSFSEVLKCLALGGAPTSPWEQTDETELLPYLDKFRTHRTAYLEGAPLSSESYEYEFPGARKLQIAIGDIVEETADAIVSADNSHLTMDFGCSLAIRTKAGESVYQLAKQFVPVLPGRVIVTPAGKLPARFIFHAATNGYAGRRFFASRDIISELVSSIIHQADTLFVRSIAVPLLGSGGAGLAPDIAFDAIFTAFVRHLHRGITNVERVRIVLYRDDVQFLTAGDESAE